MDRRAWACCRHSLRTLVCTPRIWALLILCLLCLDRYLAPITDMMSAEGLRVSWAGLTVFLLNDSWISAMTALGLLLLMNRTVLGGVIHEGAAVLMFMLPPPYVLPVFADEPAERVQISSALSALTVATMVLYAVFSVVVGIQ